MGNTEPKKKLLCDLREKFSKQNSLYFEAAYTPAEIVEIFKQRQNNLDGLNRSQDYLLDVEYKALIQKEREVAALAIESYYLNIECLVMSKDLVVLWDSRLK